MSYLDHNPWSIWTNQVVAENHSEMLPAHTNLGVKTMVYKLFFKKNKNIIEITKERTYLSLLFRTITQATHMSP